VIGIVGPREPASARCCAGGRQGAAGCGRGARARQRAVAGTRRSVGTGQADALLLDHALAERTPSCAARRGGPRAAAAGRRDRAGGFDEEDLLRQLCDELWWLDGGRMAAKGDPGETLDAIAARDAASAGERRGEAAALAPNLRRGDGRARVLSIETLDGRGQPAAVWQSGEEVPSGDGALRAGGGDRWWHHDRNRIGFEVYAPTPNSRG